MKNILTLMATGILLTTSASSVLANTKTSKTFFGWQVDCVQTDKAKACAMSQILVNQKTKQRVMSMTIRKPKDEESRVVLQVPLGASLASGVILTLDNAKPVMFVYKTCLPKGCVAEFKLTEEWVTALGGGANCTVSVVGLKGESVPFKIGLKGFTEAYTYFAAEAP